MRCEAHERLFFQIAAIAMPQRREAAFRPLPPVKLGVLLYCGFYKATLEAAATMFELPVKGDGKAIPGLGAACMPGF